MPKVERTRNAKTMTEAEYWGKVRSALRKAFAYWKPAQAVMQRMRRPNENPLRPLKKWEWICEQCGCVLERDEVKIDHVHPCGPLRSADDVVTFLERLTCEDTEAYQGLCEQCHRVKTNDENAARRSNRAW
jgi:capsule polysaccharide export protein KpsC/LpsZ